MSAELDETQQSRKGLKIAAGVLLGALVVFFLAFAIDYAMNKDKVPRGSTVAGVEIGNLTPEEAEATLEDTLGQALQEPVQVRAGTEDSGMHTAQVVPAAAGLSIDWQGTVEQAGTRSANPITWIKGFFTTRELDLVSNTDPALFDPEAERLQQELTVVPVDGSLSLIEGRVETEEAIVGQDIEVEQVREAVTSQWLHPEGVTVPAKEHYPAVTQEMVDAAAEGPAAKAVSGSVIAHGRDNVDGVIPPERMGEVVSFQAEENELKPQVNVEAAEGIFNEALSATEVTKRNARVNLSGVVTPHSDGVEIDWEATLDGLQDRIIGDQPREFDVVYVDDKATYTTDMAQQATFNDVVGEFTTSGYSASSGTNIALVAQTVNGAFLAPGETFSLNGYTGPRGAAQGYVESGIILNGRADKAVGGGISQFATTLYNAAYFAGMTDVAHTPHSYYISRYPAGREATVFEGAIDLQFRNDSDYPVIIQASAVGGSVTVQLIGTKTVQVESINGGRWAHTQPQPVNISGDDCIPSSGIPGFTTSDTRVIRNLSGTELSRETQTTVYTPQPIVRCS